MNTIRMASGYHRDETSSKPPQGLMFNPRKAIERIWSDPRNAGMSWSKATALEVRVYYEDTDFSGRVYHASYLRFLERGRTEWLRQIGFGHRELAATSGLVFAVRRLQIEYLAPALMDDLLSVESRASFVRGASLEFQQRIVLDGRELVTAAVLVVALREGRPARIPERLRRGMEESGRSA